MKRRTEEEYDALDEYLTNTDPEFTDVPGVFERQKYLLDSLDPIAASYIKTCADATNRKPSQVVSEIVRKTISAAAVL